MPMTDIAPTNVFQAAIFLALGLYFVINHPESKMPTAENATATVPVTKLSDFGD